MVIIPRRSEWWRSATLTAGPCASLPLNRQLQTSCLVGLGRSPVRTTGRAHRLAERMDGGCSSSGGSLRLDSRDGASNIAAVTEWASSVPISAMSRWLTRRSSSAVARTLAGDQAVTGVPPEPVDARTPGGRTGFGWPHGFIEERGHLRDERSTSRCRSAVPGTVFRNGRARIAGARGPLLGEPRVWSLREGGSNGRQLQRVLREMQGQA